MTPMTADQELIIISQASHLVHINFFKNKALTSIFNCIVPEDIHAHPMVNGNSKGERVSKAQFFE